jgi:hypothetical protein
MIKNLCCFFFFVSTMTSFLQAQNDTIRPKPKRKYNFFAPDSSEFKRTFSFQFDNRSSFIQKSPVNIQGLGIGYTLTPKIQIGFGVYKINRNFFQKKAIQNNKPNNVVDLNLVYATPNIVYTFFDNRWFEFSIPLEIGFGFEYAFLENPITKAILKKGKPDYFVPAEIGIAGTFKLNRWVGFSASVGYRKLIWQTDATQKDRFDGYYYNSGLDIYLGTIYRDLKYVHAHRRKKVKP